MTAQDNLNDLTGLIYRLRGGRITAEQYDEAIQLLQDAKTQLAPDGRHCAVCHDSGHQAWECHFNPLVMAYRGAKAQNEWRCFHCGTVCFTVEDARAHFGASEEEVARCLHPTDDRPADGEAGKISLQNEDASLREAIMHIRQDAVLHYATELADRLDYLQDCVLDDDEPSSISLDSVNALLVFLRAQPNFRLPSITITPSGECLASWEAALMHLSLRFYHGRRASFVVMRINDVPTNKPYAFSGECAVDHLYNLLKPHGINAWCASV